MIVSLSYNWLLTVDSVGGSWPAESAMFCVKCQEPIDVVSYPKSRETSPVVLLILLLNLQLLSCTWHRNFIAYLYILLIYNLFI
jgi:hypothetical protein